MGVAAADVLNNVQSVSVDQQTGELSLRGNTNVRVLIDGKPTNIPTDQLLQQIPSSAIKNIELITNPSAKYNPEGNSGIINIELVKNTQLGANGSVSLNSQYGRNFRHTAGVNLNYKTKNVNFYGNYNINDGKKNTQGSLERKSPTTNYQDIDGNDDFTNQLFKVGADIDITKKTSIGISTSQSFVDLDYQNNTKISNTKNAPLLSDNQFTFTRKPRNQSYNAGIYQQFGENKDHKLSLEGMYSKNAQPEDSQWEDTLDPDPSTNPSSNYTEEIANNNDLTLINLDYTFPFAKDSYIETGLSLREENTDNYNNSTQEVSDSNNQDVTRGLSNFTYGRKIYAAYFNYKQQFNALGIQAGLRAESYNIEGDFHTDVDNQDSSIQQKVNSLYPSFFATYELNDDNQLQFSYSRRVDRPSIRQVTPIRSWGTPLTTSRGNPDLKQEFTNSLEVRYNREVEIGSLSATAFFRNTKDNISRTVSVDPTMPDRAVLSYDNFDDTNSYGFELAAYLRIINWWRLNASTDFYTRKIKGFVANQNRTVTNNRFNFRANNTFTATDKLSIQLSAMYRGASESLQRVRKPMYQVSTGASYKVLKDKGIISLGVSDIFNTFGVKFSSDAPFEQDGEFKWETRKITLGFVYNFGIKPKERENGRQDHGQEGDGGGDMF
ncbi:TonB-dependent receptor domain-containing protein [Wenyingzhuangia sp. IMCC45467]